MALKTYDTREEIPEAQRAAAIETAEHKFIVDEPPTTEELTAAGKRALEAERQAKEAAVREQAKLTEKLKELQREKDAKSLGVSEEVLAKIRQDEIDARKPLLDQLESLTQKNDRLERLDVIRGLALGHGVMSERIEEAMEHLERRCVRGDAGGIIVMSKDFKTPTTEPLDNFLKVTFKAERPWLYYGAGAVGTGADAQRLTPAPVPEQMDQKRREIAGSF